MKKLLLLLQLSFISSAFGQYSDTTTCISGPDQLTFAVHYYQQHCTDSCDGSYTIDVLVGSGNYTYSVIGSSYNSTLVSDTSLCPDDYVAVVTDLTTGIVCTLPFSVDTLQPFSATINLTNCSATGVCDGEAELIITGGIPPYDIDWYDAGPVQIPFENEPILDSLCAGNYFYDIGYSQPCCSDTCPPGTWGVAGTGLVPFIINEPLTVVVDWTIDEMCPWMCDGAVGISAFGGTGNYIFDIGVDANPSGSFSFLCPGPYTVFVFDDAGNSGFAVFDIWPAPMPNPVSTVFPESCPGLCDGQIITQDLTGSTVQYSNDGGITFTNFTGIFDNLCSNIYDIWGMNAFGCIYPLDFVSVLPGSSLSLTNPNVTNPTGPTTTDGCINSVDVIGGSPPYQYYIDGNPVTLPACNLTEGVYIVTVIDANGCSGILTIALTATCALNATLSVNSEITCNMGCDGELEIAITGASGNTSIVWQNGTGQTVGTSSTLSNMCFGSYTYTVTDDAGCTATGTYVLFEPAPLVVTAVTTSPNCTNPCSGQAIGIASGGTPPYQYSLDGITYSPNDVFTGLCENVYIMYVQDASGCIQIYTFQIVALPSISISNSVINQYTDPTNCTGSIVATITGGQAPYTYVWMDCANDSVVDNSNSPMNLCEGAYYVEVTDNNDCVVQSTCDTIFSTASVDELSTLDWKVYPNPTLGSFTIETELEGEYSISIYAITGSMIKTQKVNQSTVNYSSEDINLSKGVYTILVEQEDLRVHKRLVIK